ncbi:MAG: AbrB/MazE/SpoVT family DNA-binding domain-containing protein [Betaproteobacteria bacterium]|nr:AbrB/MazE/SpoVT family DNA-binding domain-containing protein [Betaproteobacteria bacterium]
MATSVLTSKGQITIPKQVREALGVETGDRVEFVEVEKGVFSMVAATRDIRALKGSIPKPSKPVSTDEMKRAIARMGGRR